MNISMEVGDVIVDGEIGQTEWQKKYNRSSQLLTISVEGGDFIFLNFKSPEALIDFCNKHNFPLKDKRNEK